MKTAVIYDKWLSGLGGGEVVACTMARTLKDAGYDVLFLSKDQVSPDAIKEKLGIDLHDITFKQVASESDLSTSHQPLTTDIFINLSFMDYSYGIGKKNIYYVHFPTIEKQGKGAKILKSLGLSGLGLFDKLLLFFQATNLHLLFPNPIREKISDRLRAGIYPNLKKRLASYDTFITHSEYVKKWIQKSWNIDAKVLYPPVSLLTTHHQPLTTKKDWIVSVGRFFTLGHGKKQEVMIQAFKMLNDKLQMTNEAKDLELHLIGGVGSEASSLRFIDELRAQAQGYPIYFHFNVDRKEIEEVLLKSKIYWHATGFGEDPEKDPIKFEHFGIAPIEAISAGCVPILFDGGGLREIINILHLDPKLHLFSTVDELCNKTISVLKSKSTRKKASRGELESVFSFNTQFLKLIQK